MEILFARAQSPVSNCHCIKVTAPKDHTAGLYSLQEKIWEVLELEMSSGLYYLVQSNQ